MTGLPLPLDRMKLGAAAPSSAEAIRHVSVRDRVLEDFRPLTHCLEWELSELYWRSDGVLAFVRDPVPFLINNSGKLSEDAATVLFANCVEFAPEGPIAVLDLGAEVGLFALLSRRLPGDLLPGRQGMRSVCASGSPMPETGSIAARQVSVVTAAQSSVS